MRTMNLDQNGKRNYIGSYTERDHGLENGAGEIKREWRAGGGEGSKDSVGGNKRGAEAAATHVEV